MCGAGYFAHAAHLAIDETDREVVGMDLVEKTHIIKAEITMASSAKGNARRHQPRDR
jgi:hypothetical protein